MKQDDDFDIFDSDGDVEEATDSGTTDNQDIDLNNQDAAESVNDTMLQDYQDALRNFYYFNQGFKGDELSANFSTCGDRGAYWYYLELKTYRIKM